MATEEEAREAADGEEVQLEAVGLETADVHMHLDGKLSSNKGIKDDREIMDAHEGTLKITEDQVLEEEPSVVKTPPEHTSNGTTSSLNGHTEEGKISNQKSHEDEKDEEQLEVSLDGTSTNQGNKSNGEDTTNSLDHGKRTTEDTSLLKHENEEPKEHDQSDLEGNVMDDKMVHEDILKTDNDVEPTIDAQHDQNLESAKASENTQPASKTCIPDEVVTEELSGVQTVLEPNVDDSDALQDTSSGNPETVEPAKVHKESCPEDENIAQHTYEIVKLEDQQSKQADEVDADMVHEETPKGNKTDLPGDMPKTEQADELPNDAQEVLNQESPAEASSPVCEKTEETSHESSMAAYEDITTENDATSREPAVDIQEVQNHGSVEEITDAEEVDTEKPMQQNGVAFEEAIPEDHVAATEPSSYIQHVHNVESEDIKGVEDVKAEETSNRTHAAFAEDAVQDKEALSSEPPTDVKPVQGLEQEEAEDVRTVETDDASDQTHADVFNNLAEEDSVAASEPQVTVLEEVVKDIEATGTQDINHQSHAAASEEVVREDNSTASEPTNDDIQQALEQGSVEVTDAKVAEPDTQVICHERTISSSKDTVEHEEGPTRDAQAVQNVATDEEIKDNMTDNIVEVPNVAEQEKNVLVNEDIAGQKTRELEPEEIMKTEPVVAEEASDQTHAAPFSDPAREDITTSEMPKTESTVEVKETEATNTEANPEESNVSISDEPTPEDNITPSETANDTCEIDNVKLAEDIEGNKDTRSEEISDQINGAFDGEAAKGINEHATEPTVDIQSGKDLESEKMSNTELVQVSEASHGMDAAVLENPSQEDSPTTSQLHVMESAGEVSNSGTTEGQTTSHQSNVAQPEDQETEESTASSEPQIREPESLEEMKDIEATEPPDVSQRSINSTSEEFVPEEDATAEEPGYDNQEVRNKEPEQEHDDVKTDEISNQSSGTIVGDAAHVQAEELELQEIGNTDEASHQKHAEETLTANEPHMIESSGQMTGIEPTRPEPTLHESNVASLEEITTEDNTVVTPDVGIQHLQEQDPVEFREIEATEPEGISPSHIDSTSELSTPEDNATIEPSADTQALNLKSATVTEDTKDVKSNVVVSEEEAPEGHVLAFEATVNVPPELEETKNTEPIETQNNTTASNLPEVKDTGTMEIEAIHNDNTVANVAELTEDVKTNAVLADETAPDEHVPATESITDIPPEHEPEIEEIKDTKPVEVEDNIIASDLPAEEMQDTEAKETEAIPHDSTVASISELTEDVKSNVVLADEPITEAIVDTPPVHEPEIEEINSIKPVEVEDNITASDLPAEEVKGTEAMETEPILCESTIASIRELTEDVQSNVALADEANLEEHVLTTEATIDIPPVQDLALEEIKNTKPVEVEDNIITSDLPAEEMQDSEAKETEAVPHESTVSSINELTENVKSNVVLADEPVTEATIDIPPVHEPELEEIKDTEPVEVEDNIIASDLPAEEMQDTEAKETEAIPHDSIVASISELTKDVKSNVVLADEPVTEATVDIPPVHEPELEEINSIEPVAVEDNITASDLPAKEVKGIEAMETEPILPESTVASIRELTEDVQSNVVLADEAAPEEHVLETEAVVDIPPVQKPALEEIKDTKPVEVEYNIIASDLPAEEMQDTEAKETEATPHDSTVASISELTEDVKSNVVLADEPVTEAIVDTPPVHEPEIEEVNSIEPAEVEDNIIASDLLAEEVKGTEATETESMPREGTVASIGELSEDLQSNVSLADEAAPEEHALTNKAIVDIPPVQEPTLEEIKDTELVEVEDNIIASDLPAEEIQDNEAKETEAIPHMSNEDDILTVSAPLPDIQQAPVEESVEDEKYTDTTEYQGEPQQSTVSASDELTPTEERTAVTEPTSNINVKNVTAQEIKDTKDVETEKNLPAPEVVAQESAFLGSEPTSDAQQVQEQDSTEEIKGTEAVQTEDYQQYGVSTLEKSVPENTVTESEPNVDGQKVQEDKSALEVRGIGANEPEEISNQSNITTTKNAAQGSSELGSDPELFVQSAQQLELAEDGKGSQPAKEEETGQSNATLEEPTAEDNASNEIDPPADAKQGHGLEPLEENRDIDDTEPEETSCTSQNAASEEPASTTEPTYDIQQASDLEEEKEIKGNEAVTAENCQKSEIAILEDASPADNGTALEHPVESNEENLVNEINNVTLVNEKIKDETQELTEQKAAQDVAEKDDTVKSGEHTDGQDNEQLHDMVLQMQVCDRSVDAFAIEQKDEAAQNVNLDQQQKEDDEIEKKTKEIQTDEKKHDDNSADFTPETLSDPQCIEIGTTNRKEDDDTVKAEQTETVATEMLNNDQTLHILQESIPGIGDVDVENSTEIKDGTEEENAPNNAGSLHADAENYNEYEKENTEKDAAVAKTSADVNGTTDEIRNEEIGDGLASSIEEDLQNKFDPAPSDEEMLENVEDGKLAITGHNAVEGEDIKQTREDQGATNADDVVQLEPEKVALDRISETDSNEKLETSYTVVTEAVKFDEAICDKVSGADGALSHETFGTSQETRRNLDASPVVTVSEGESMNEDKEHHKLALPAQPTLDRNTNEHASTLEETERESSLPEKTLRTEPEEQNEMQITNEEDEENIHEDKVDETQNEAKEAEECDLPVSHFLMNLIMGKESNDPDGNSQFEDEKKQEETTKDGSCITSQQEESLVPKPTENKVDDILIFEQEKQNLEGSEETHGFKVETDEELGQNTHDLEASVNQHNAQDEISSELVPGEASGQVTEMKTRDFELGERAVDSISQQHMEETTQIEEGSLKRNIDESTSSKASQENSLEEERTELLHESLPEDGSSDAMAEKSVLSTEPDMGDENKVPNKTNDLQSPLSTKQEESTESSITEAETALEVQPENEVDKEEENHHSTSGGAIEEQIENLHDTLQDGTGSEAISDEQKPEIIEPVSGTEKNLVHEKEISAGSACMEEKQSYKFSNNELGNYDKIFEMQSDGPNLHINKDTKDESADNQIVMEKNSLLDKQPEQSSLQEQETDIAQISLQESDEGCKHSLALREPVLKEENARRTVANHEQTEGIKSNEEQEAFNSQVQERDLDVVSPKEAPEVKETFVGKPEFRTDEEQSPKKDESNMTEEKTYNGNTMEEAEAEGSTDEAIIRSEERGSIQKASHHQERDLDVVLTKEAPETEENFVHITKPEFSTDEEQSPKKDESNMAEDRSYDEKTKDDKEAKNFTDEVATKIEEQEAGLKVSAKKHNILSGVGSKVKHQLAKVKKAIIGKPGHAKSESPKS